MKHLQIPFEEKGILKIIKGRKIVAQVEVEIATSPIEHFQALMYRNEMQENTGVVFKFENPVLPAIVNTNVPFPVDLIQVNESGEIEYVGSLWPSKSKGAFTTTFQIKFLMMFPIGLSKKLNLISKNESSSKKQNHFILKVESENPEEIILYRKSATDEYEKLIAIGRRIDDDSLQSNYYPTTGKLSDWKEFIIDNSYAARLDAINYLLMEQGWLQEDDYDEESTEIEKFFCKNNELLIELVEEHFDKNTACFKGLDLYYFDINDGLINPSHLDEDDEEYDPVSIDKIEFKDGAEIRFVNGYFEFKQIFVPYENYYSLIQKMELLDRLFK